MTVKLESEWSRKYNKRLHKVSIEGVGKTLMLSDDELADLIRRASEVLYDNGIR